MLVKTHLPGESVTSVVWSQPQMVKGLCSGGQQIKTDREKGKLIEEEPRLGSCGTQIKPQK